MKRIYLYFTTVVFILFIGLSFTACDEDSSEGGSQALSVSQFFPTKLYEGQEVQITGTGLNEVTAVIFPNGKSVSSFTVLGKGLISVITPAGVSNGILSVQAGSNTASANVSATVANPRISSMMPNDEAGIGRELSISGVDMEFYVNAIFPGKAGDIVVNAIEFTRKSTSFVFLNVPEGIESGPARIKLITTSGRVDLLPEITLVGAPDEPKEVPDVVVWEGEHELRGWSNNFEIIAQWFRDAGLTIKKGDIIKLHFTPTNSFHQFKFNDYNWNAISLPETLSDTSSSDPAVVTSSGNLKGVDVFEFEVNEALVPIITRSGATATSLIINGEGILFTKISVAVAK